jgi:hypothetical protein
MFIDYMRTDIRHAIRHLYYNILILCVWPFIDSEPEHDRKLRTVSLEPVWPEGVQPQKIILPKSDEIIKEKTTPPILFNGKVLFWKAKRYKWL